VRYFIVVNILWAAAAVVACRNESSGCSKDTDCKGTRVCQIGQWVEASKDPGGKRALEHYTDKGDPVPPMKLP
jgi:hypothetical protein